MARKAFSEDEPWSSPRASASAAIDIDSGTLDPTDARVLDLKPEQDSPFLRTQKRVPVRRGALPKKTALKLKYVLLAAAALAVLVVIAGATSRYGRSSWRFRLESSDQIQVAGTRNASRAQVMEVFGQDISRNVFAIPLSERKRQLERIPWVESATVMRLLPNRLNVSLTERTPIAFAQLNSRIMLVDAKGALMNLPAAPQKYSFPVIVGLAENEPLSKRAASVHLYQTVLRELDAGGANYSRDLDAVDLGDPEDVKVTVIDHDGPVLVHLGGSNFLDRYKIFVAHVQEWRQQFHKVDSVDLRYDGQVVVNPDMPRAPAASTRAVTPAKPAKPHVAARRQRRGKPSAVKQKNNPPAPKHAIANSKP
jgi:cell division protein FtsQ